MVGLSIFQLQRADLAVVIAAAQLEEGDNSPAMNEIVRRFEPLTQRLSRTLTSREHLHDDLANVARFALTRAVRRHDLARPGFPAYAERFMRGAALRELRRWRPERGDGEPDIIPLPLLDSDAVAGEDLEAALVEKLSPWGDGAVAEAIDSLGEEQHLIATMRYVEDASLAVIAASVGTSQSAVGQRLSTIHRGMERALAA